jgi:hypothetical protein
MMLRNVSSCSVVSGCADSNVCETSNFASHHKRIFFIGALFNWIVSGEIPTERITREQVTKIEEKISNCGELRLQTPGRDLELVQLELVMRKIEETSKLDNLAKGVRYVSEKIDRAFSFVEKDDEDDREYEEGSRKEEQNAERASFETASDGQKNESSTIESITLESVPVLSSDKGNNGTGLNPLAPQFQMRQNFFVGPQVPFIPPPPVPPFVQPTHYLLNGRIYVAYPDLRSYPPCPRYPTQPFPMRPQYSYPVPPCNSQPPPQPRPFSPNRVANPKAVDGGISPPLRSNNCPDARTAQVQPLPWYFAPNAQLQNQPSLEPNKSPRPRQFLPNRAVDHKAFGNAISPPKHRMNQPAPWYFATTAQSQTTPLIEPNKSPRPSLIPERIRRPIPPQPTATSHSRRNTVTTVELNDQCRNFDKNLFYAL